MIRMARCVCAKRWRQRDVGCFHDVIAAQLELLSQLELACGALCTCRSLEDSVTFFVGKGVL